MNTNQTIAILEPILVQQQFSEEESKLFQVMSKAHFSRKADTTEDEATEIFGEFDTLIMYSDYPDYCLILDSMTEPEVINCIVEWMNEINLIS